MVKESQAKIVIAVSYALRIIKTVVDFYNVSDEIHWIFTPLLKIKDLLDYLVK